MIGRFYHVVPDIKSTFRSQHLFCAIITRYSELHLVQNECGLWQEWEQLEAEKLLFKEQQQTFEEVSKVPGCCQEIGSRGTHNNKGIHCKSFVFSC